MVKDEEIETGTNGQYVKRTASKKYILSCDIGTSTLRCVIFNEKAVEVGSAVEKITIISGASGHVEIDPDDLWDKFTKAIHSSFENAQLRAIDMLGMGICTQRGSFLLWDRRTGKALTNFITWKDIRADSLVKERNNSFVMKMFRMGTGLLYKMTRIKRFLAASSLRFQNIQVSPRLKWVLENNEEVRKVLRLGNLMFGTIDTWLVYRLTDGKVHATDHSNASATGMYDPFLSSWSNLLINLLKLPSQILPEVWDTNCHWGDTDPRHFGAAIPITAVVSDQGAALFGNCGFRRGDIKITMGTGAFLDLNTGSTPHTSIKGIYPVVGWKDQEGLTCMAEGSSNDNGVIIQWGKNMKLYRNYTELTEMAESVEDSNGIYFVPSFQGLQAPINDANATGGFLGLKVDTRPEHLVRAMIESLAFRVCQIFLAMKDETNFDFKSIRIDGGVSRNNFLMQTISTLTGVVLERPKDIETSSRGCCFLAGLGAGLWKSKSELASFASPIEQTFRPQMDKREALMLQMSRWENALGRFTKWRPDSIVQGHKWSF